MTRPLVLVLLVAFSARAQDAGVPAVLDVERASVQVRDGGVLTVVGGAWMRDDVLLARAQDLERLSAENKKLKESVEPMPLPLFVGLVAGLCAGAVAGYFIAKR